VTEPGGTIGRIGEFYQNHVNTMKRNSPDLHKNVFYALMAGLSIFIGCQSPSSDKSSPVAAGEDSALPVKISYYTANAENSTLSHAGLYALIGSKKYTVIPEGLEEGGRCIEVIDSADFDQDGYSDALIMHIQACGGNASGNAFFFCSYAKEADSFRLSEEFGQSWGDPTVEIWKGKPSVKVISSLQGSTTDMAKRTERFILENGKAVRVEYVEAKLIPAIIELRSADFTEKDKDKKIRFDLDGDGKKDVITGSFWERWGSIGWSVTLANGKIVAGDDARKRVGVLPSKTKGVHDLVLDLDEVLVWNGNKYVEKGE
jgi:hypothetical protein